MVISVDCRNMKIINYNGLIDLSRSNCADCLDRTNAVQLFIGKFKKKRISLPLLNIKCSVFRLFHILKINVKR